MAAGCGSTSPREQLPVPAAPHGGLVGVQPWEVRSEPLELRHRVLAGKLHCMVPDGLETPSRAQLGRVRLAHQVG